MAICPNRKQKKMQTSQMHSHGELVNLPWMITIKLQKEVLSRERVQIFVFSKFAHV